MDAADIQLHPIPAAPSGRSSRAAIISARDHPLARSEDGDVGLESFIRGFEVSESASHINESSLAPVDRGIGAWSFLISAFFIEALVWGFPNAYGVFLVKYLDDPTWSSQKHANYLLPLIGPLSSGMMYCAGPITYPLAARYPRHRNISKWVGAALLFLSLFGASFAHNIPTLIALQGVLYAIGGALLYATAIYYMSEWFVERRGLANGVINAGTAAGGVVLPLILPTLLDKYGSSKTLRYISIVETVLLVMVLPFVKGRLPESRVRPPTTRTRQDTARNRAYLKNRTFWVMNAITTIQGLAYFVPILWLPAYASSLQISPSSSSLALSLLNGASVVGRLSLGILSDKVDTWLLAFTTLMSSAIAVFVLWGLLSYSFAGILVYGIAYGYLAGGFTSLWTGFTRPVAKDDPALSTTLFGFLMFFRGIGNILSTPISTALQPSQPAASPSPSARPRHQIAFKVANGQYENVIIYAGTCFAAAALVVGVGWMIERRYPSQSSTRR